MTDVRSMLVETAVRLFGDTCNRGLVESAEKGVWPQSLWEDLETSGIAAAAHSEERGGVGTDLGDIAALLRVSAAHAAPVPLAETWLAEMMLCSAGLAPTAGPATIGPCLKSDRLSLARSSGQWQLSGTLRRVPWGRDVRTLVVLADYEGETRTVCIDRPVVGALAWNYAREPRDTFVFDALGVPDAAVGSGNGGFGHDELIFKGALLRSVQIAGALERVLELTVQYAKERVQFGRPIGKFQAVQQQIAVLASQTAAASAAAQGAVEAATTGNGRFEIAAAKTRTSEAVGIVTAIAHQVHGAMGFTHEHSLHRSTRRLWSWRDEFGAEVEWAGWIGQTVASIGGESLWAFLTAPHATDRTARL